MVRETGASVSISPWSELLIGYGVTPVNEMEQSGMLLTLSVDTLPLTGTADLWSVARLTTGLLRGQAEQELAVNTRRILEMATIDAARSLGLGDVVGSLTPGQACRPDPGAGAATSRPPRSPTYPTCWPSRPAPRTSTP